MDCPETAESTRSQKRQVVIACQVMEPELAYCVSEGNGADDGTEILYLEQALHRTPDKLIVKVQEMIDQAARVASRIILGYGLCSKGIAGITAREVELIIPRCHDCIALFLGSQGRHLEIFREKPGTYYLTPGWVAEKKDPLGIIEENVPKFGRETAQWVVEEELKHYTHIVLIDMGVSEMAPLRARAMENANLLKKQYEEIPGSLDYFRELLRGPYTDEKFLRLGPGETFTQDMVG
ncbi:MAG: DUF1638 domain-containing protein [Deltaproteobacteria bacterium]|nr:DUF1638 domain-containing protein [Deltaproteobacteria bacterium]